MRRLFAVAAIALAAALTALCQSPRAEPSGRGFHAGADPGLAVMAGQMLLVGFRGTGEEPLHEDLRFLLEDIRQGHVGGVILFDRDAESGGTVRNIVSAGQIRNLTRMLREAAPQGLFIGLDQEGGKVRRLKEEHGFAPYPSAEELGKGPAADSFAAGERMGRELRSLGFTLNFAPSLDVNSNPESPAIGALGRSFSADAEKVAEHGLAFAKGLYGAGVIPCYKHFPGHGSAAHDTHLGLADITGTWREQELLPYKRVLGQSPPAMVMPGHIVHARISDNMPASLSRKTVQGLLRQELGWNGVVITDDLQMQAIEGRFSSKEALRLAVLAGADILLLGNNLRHDPQEGRKAHALLMELIAEGAISRQRIEESYARIMKLKAAVRSVH